MDISTIFWGRSLSGVGHFWFCFCPWKNFWYCQPTCSTLYLATGFLENPRWNRKIDFNKFLTWKKASVQFWPIFFSIYKESSQECRLDILIMRRHPRLKCRLTASHFLHGDTLLRHCHHTKHFLSNKLEQGSHEILLYFSPTHPWNKPPTHPSYLSIFVRQQSTQKNT